MDSRQFGRSTTGSFRAGPTGPPFVEMKKAEIITTRFPLIFKQHTPLDCLVMLIQMISELFKAGQVTLYIIEHEMQENIFR